jgi:hypothetical protein
VGCTRILGNQLEPHTHIALKCTLLRFFSR